MRNFFRELLPSSRRYVVLIIVPNFHFYFIIFCKNMLTVDKGLANKLPVDIWVRRSLIIIITIFGIIID